MGSIRHLRTMLGLPSLCRENGGAIQAILPLKNPDGPSWKKGKKDKEKMIRQPH